MKKLILLLVFVLPLCAAGQAPSWVWARGSQSPAGASGVSLPSIATDRFGNEYIAGSYQVPSLIFGNDTLLNVGGTEKNFYLAKYNATGELLWARSTLQTRCDVEIFNVTTDKWGNVYVTGDFGNSAPISSYAIFGTDTLYVNTKNMFLVKYDSSGNVLWATTPRSSGQSQGFSVAADTLGNVYVGGSIVLSSTLTFDSTIVISDTFFAPSSIFIVKYDAAGHALWARAPRGLRGDGCFVAADGPGNVCVTGTFESASMIFGTDTLYNPSLSGGNMYVAEYDPSGTVLWAKKPGIGVLYVASIAADAWGNAYVTGSFVDSIRFGGILLVADSFGYGSSMFLVKYDHVGNVAWAARPVSIIKKGFSDGYSIALDNSGSPYVAGNFYRSAMAFGTDTLSTPGPFIVKYDSAGVPLWAVGDAVSEYPDLSIAVGSQGSIYVTGDYNDSLKIVDTNALYAGVGRNEAFVAKLQQPLSTGIPTLTSATHGMAIYPVPNNGEMTVLLTGKRLYLAAGV